MQTEYYFHNKIMPHTKLTDLKAKRAMFWNQHRSTMFLSSTCEWHMRMDMRKF